MGIKIEKLDYVYMQGSPFERKALDNINLEINDGEFIGLIGYHKGRRLKKTAVRGGAGFSVSRAPAV